MTVPTNYAFIYLST